MDPSIRSRAPSTIAAAHDALSPKTPPGTRPLGSLSSVTLEARFARALSRADGLDGAHCVHEMWMRGGSASRIEPLLEHVWALPGDAIPNWLPMRYIEWLPELYEVAARFSASAKGRSNLYLVLLDYRDSRSQPYGIYVGMTGFTPMERFDQHKAGIRAAGSVLKRGLEVLLGPVMHLQRISRADAARIEIQMAEVLAHSGFRVKGGH